MPHFKIKYLSNDDTIKTVIIYADHCAEAIGYVECDYSDFKDIISTNQLDHE